MKTFIITIWMVCSLSFSFASVPSWKTPDDLIAWLQTKEEMNVSEHTGALRAWVQFENEGGLDERRDLLGISLIDELAFRRFVKLREGRDLPGVAELFEAHYDTSLKNRMFSALSDGKDDEFSARVVHHALGRKNWSDPRANILNLPLRRNLFNKLMGGPETLQRIGSDFSLEDQQAMKHALEEKWPVVLEEPVTPRDRKPPVQEIRRDTAADDYIQKDRPVHPRSSGEKGSKPWVIGFLFLLATVLAFAFIKSRRGT